MKEIPIRTRQIRCASSALIDRCPALGRSLAAHIRQCGDDVILSEVFHEEHPLSFLKARLPREGEPSNACFQRIYQISPDYGVGIDAHIDLYRFDPDLALQQLALWGFCYAESKLSLGDTWWFCDEEILHDVQTLPIPAFYRKYKGF